MLPPIHAVPPPPWAALPGLADLTVARAELWMLSLLRISFMVFLLPVFDSDEIPGAAKAGLSFFISLALFPALPPSQVAVPHDLGGFAALALRELYVGAVMGFAFTFAFHGLRMAGAWIDQETGFNAAQVLGPLAGGDEETAMSQFLSLVFAALLLSSGAYLLYLQAVAESFRAIALASAEPASGPVLQAFTWLTADAFLFGLKAAAPVVATLFVSSVALAVVARIMPQMNVWLVGMPMKLGLGLGLVFLLLSPMWRAFLGHQAGVLAVCSALLRAMGGGHGG